MSVTILVGDAIEEMRAMPDGSIDVVLTDPPYSSGARREAGATLRTKKMTRRQSDVEWFGSDSLSTRGFEFLIRGCALEWRRLLVPGGHALVFIDWRMMSTMAAAIESADLRPLNVLVWDKGRIGMGTHFRKQAEYVLHFSNGDPRPPQRRDVAEVLQHAPPRNPTHPTQKPVGLLRDLISVTCPPGGRILDCFAGSGSGAVAAGLARASFVGIEREARYVAAWARSEQLQQGLFAP